ncbi:hypothetical protein A9Q83_01835 [Alphaproteobacteria bacterium 46_93_T64]|nr:hypothetical protein A9Q83_01835 [Alphaproteobacteria bacterium 46_93_T64]
MIGLMKKFYDDESGVTSVEYALLAAAAAGAVLAAGETFYAKVSTALQDIDLGTTSSTGGGSSL